jgi:hypothetical protein
VYAALGRENTHPYVQTVRNDDDGVDFELVVPRNVLWSLVSVVRSQKPGKRTSGSRALVFWERKPWFVSALAALNPPEVPPYLAKPALLDRRAFEIT